MGIHNIQDESTIGCAFHYRQFTTVIAISSISYSFEQCRIQLTSLPYFVFCGPSAYLV